MCCRTRIDKTVVAFIGFIGALSLGAVPLQGVDPPPAVVDDPPASTAADEPATPASDPAADDAKDPVPERPVLPATDPPVQQPEPSSDVALRPIRVAIFDLKMGKDVDVEPAAMTDQINVMVEALPGITTVNRNEIDKVAAEHQMALSGLVASGAAVKLGGFLGAEYVLVGRASRIGQTYYLVLKIIDVETTVQTVVSVKALVEVGVDTLLQRLDPTLTSAFAALQVPKAAGHADDPLAALRVLAAPLRGSVVVIDVSEEHVSRPLKDPAASMALLHRLGDLGIEAIRPANPITGWKEALLQTGHYGDHKVDYLLEGEGTSAYAAEIQGMVSCRARVELRLVPVPGRRVLVADRGIGARVDLVESLAAKSALEDAATEAFDALLARLSRNGAPKPKTSDTP